MSYKVKTSLAVLALVALLAGGMACTRVKSNEVGVRVNNLPVIHKVEKDPKLTGWYWQIPNIHTFIVLPRTQMKIQMIKKGEVEFRTPGPAIESKKVVPEEEQEQAHAPEQQMEQFKKEVSKSDRVRIVIHDRRHGNESVRIKTADGNDAWVNVIVAYRIMPEGAYKVVQKIGKKKDIESFVASMVRGTLRSWLSELDSSEILRPHDRKVQVEGVVDSQGNVKKRGALHELNNRLSDFGIKIDKISAPEVVIHPGYEEVLSKKRIAEEEREEYLAYQNKARQERWTKVNKARGEADSMIELANGRLAKTRQEADAELEARKLKSQAMRVKYNQRAEGVQAQTAVLAGPGGDTYVGMAISEAIQGKPIIIVPGEGSLQTMDLNELVQTYGGVKSIRKDKKEKSSQDKNILTEDLLQQLPQKPEKESGK
ncbi:MAG: SPFH domain-containing protein [bacterium]